MIITDQFVYIHMPKTGGTFASTMIEKIHEARGDRIVHRKDGYRPGLRTRIRERMNQQPTLVVMSHEQTRGEWNQHGIVSQIPLKHLNKIVLTTLRNPYDRYVSQYEFQWWKNNPSAFTTHMDDLLQKYPHYPDITFEEFVYLSNDFFLTGPNKNLPEEKQLGWHTLQFMRYFFLDPSRIMLIDETYIKTKQYVKELHPRLRFTFTSTLNQDLHDFLIEMNYDAEEIAFILSHEKIFPKEGGRSEDQKWQKYYTPELKAWLRNREWLLFEMFPHFDV